MKLHFNGGLNEQQTPTLFECINGYNFELGLRQSKLVPRKPYDLKGTATNALAINGFIQLIKRDDTETTLLQAGNTVYEWDGASTFTSRGTVNANSKLRGVTWSLGDYSVVTDIAKLTVVKKWNGSSFSTLTTGLGTDLYAKYGIVHNNRVWLANVKTTSDTPHLIAASKFEDPESYDTTQRAVTGSFASAAPAFYILSPDLRPINGMTVFQKELIISTEGGRLFKLTGSSPTDYAFVDFYAGSAAVGDESLANIGNDVIFMKAGGNIDLLSSTERFGDVSADDLSRWIPDTVEDLTEAITVYDQARQKVLFFVTNKVLALFKDLVGGELSPWSVYKTSESFAFNTNAAIYMRRPGATTYSVFFGDSAGRVFDLNGSAGGGDAGSVNIDVLRKTRFIPEGEGGDRFGRGALDFTRQVLHGEVVYRRVADACDCTVSFDWGDEYNTSSSVVPLKGAPTGQTGVYYSAAGMYFNGDDYYSQGSAFSQKISSQTFSPTGKGPGCFISVSLGTKTDFQIDYIAINER